MACTFAAAWAISDWVQVSFIDAGEDVAYLWIANSYGITRNKVTASDGSLNGDLEAGWHSTTMRSVDQLTYIADGEKWCCCGLQYRRGIGGGYFAVLDSNLLRSPIRRSVCRSS